ncbi:MAG: RNA polymerase sigma-70 factor [Saprospiraceae bacterium]
MSQGYTDIEIKQLFLKDPDQAIEVLFRAYFPYICTIIYKFIPNSQVAEDLAQDIFFDLWKRKDRLQFTGSIKAYLRRSSINKSMNFLRDQKPEAFSESPENEIYTPIQIDPSLADQELQQQIDAAIDQLPERCRIIFILSRFDDLTYKEIGQLLDIAPKTVENQIVKALRLLRQSLGPYLSSILLILLKIYWYT